MMRLKNRIALAYVVMLLMALLVLFAICRHGEALPKPGAEASTVPATQKITSADNLLRVLTALIAVVVTGLVLAKCFVFLGQPPVIGEVIAGIVLGPSLVGREMSAFILPASVSPFLDVLAQIGVILYMFSVGLTLHSDRIRERMRSALAISHASIVVPFLSGAALSLLLYRRFAGSGVSFTNFALFLGIAMSITAFPVLARILSDRGMIQTDLGATAITCAAIDDVTAWCLLALVVGAAKSQSQSGLLVAAGAVAYVAAMIFLIRPMLHRLVGRWSSEEIPRNGITCILLFLLCSAWTTESLGIHAIFGAFLFGAIIPHDSPIASKLSNQLESVTLLFLPAFFAYTGMRTRLDLMTGADHWILCGLIILVATIGKFGGTLVAARFTGHRWREALALGTLMNTRGLMELIVLNIGLDLNVISPTLFSMMIFMALVTTLTTAPIVKLLVPEAR